MATDKEHMVFPQRSYRAGRDSPQTAVREIYEETGRQVYGPEKDLGVIERPGFTRIPRTRDLPNEQKYESVLKRIHLFLFRTEDGKLDPVDKKHSAAWFNLKDAIESLPHDAEKEILRANEKLIIDGQ